MSTSERNRRWIGWRGALVAMGLWMAWGPHALGQAPGLPGGNAGFNAAVAKLFSDIPAFVANVETSITNKADQSRMTMPMRMAKDGDRFRIEIDLVKVRGNSKALQGLPAMQNIGMSRMTSLVLPEEKGMVVLFPDLKFHTRVALSEADLPSAGFKVTRKAAGKETINGQPCTKQNVTLTAPDGERTEVTVWESTSQGNFPVRMMFRPDDSVMLMNFTDIQLQSPGAEAFKVPADSKAFGSIAGLMAEAMTKAFTPAGR